MAKSYVGAYWSGRAESADAAADRIARFVPKLAAIDPLLSGWRDGGRSQKEALEQPLVTLDHDDLVARLLAGRNRTDVGHQVIESLGYLISWWNGADGQRSGAKVTIHIGADSTAVGNSLVLDLPDPAVAPAVYAAETAKELLHTIIEIFEPDWAVWTNRAIRNKQKEPDQPTDDGGYILGSVIGHPAGWANYLGDADSVTFTPSLLPPSATLERLQAGDLVTIGNDPANPPIRDVLTVRVAMGYPPPPDLTPNEPHAVPGATISDDVHGGTAPIGTPTERHPTDGQTGNEPKPLPGNSESP